MFNDYVNENKEYQDNLWNKDIGKEARLYLQKRNLSPLTAKIWQLGYSPKGFIPKCYQTDKYKDANYKFWEKMNGRITIPVYDSNGVLIAISGRAIDSNMKPKYMHYQFPTRKVLFGLYVNELEIMKNNAVIFTEGQFDVISAWQHGLKICACTFGAHFSSEQIATASRYTNRINILYDSDEAGQEGAMKSLDKLETRGDTKVRILKNVLKNGEDLDEWIKKNNYNFILKVINSSEESILKYKLKLLENKI